MPTPRSWVAVTATEDLPVSMKPVEAAMRGVAPVKTVPLPYSKLSLEEESRFAEMFQGAAGMLVRAGYVTPTLLDQLPDMRIVAVHGAGVDQVDVEACTERGVLVTNAPGANADAVAELTFGLMISMARRIPSAAEQVHNKRIWGDARHTGSELKGKTLGLVGMGQIGVRVTRIATDYLSLHAPHIPATHQMINRKALATMKKGAFLINAARGQLVDEKAVAQALKSGRLGGAALDVLSSEPPDPESPIFDAPNILLTPHMAGSTQECLDTIAGTAGADIARFLQGKRPKYPVNKPVKRKSA